MPSIVFYSWQSDLPNATNRGFIHEALENAAKAIRDDDSIKVEPVIDRDTAGVPGSPDIAATILAKIDNWDVFVCDVSITNQGSGGRPTPNPNVLVELGYAIKKLGWQRITMVMNTTFGSKQELPFDLRMKRVLLYNLPEDEQEKASERRILGDKLEQALKLIFQMTKEAQLEVSPTIPLTSDYNWRDLHRTKALQAYPTDKFSIYMEIFATLSEPRVRRNQGELLHAADGAMIHAFGWPIGVMDRSQGDVRPKPVNDGIVNMVMDDDSFDYWALRTDGAFYLLKSLFEEKRKKDVLFFDTRIVRTAEVVLYLARLWRNLKIPVGALAAISITYMGLQGKTLSAASHNRTLRSGRTAVENHRESRVMVPVEALEEDVVKHVRELLSPLFVLFDYFEVGENIYSEIVEEFVKGRIS